MKVIHINKPMQDSGTPRESLELSEIIEVNGGKIMVPHWMTQSALLHLDETLQMWLSRLEGEINDDPKRKEMVEGIYLYDCQALTSIPDSEGVVRSGLMVRFDYIRKGEHYKYSLIDL